MGNEKFYGGGLTLFRHFDPLNPTRKHVGFNKIVTLNSTSQVIKRMTCLACMHAVQLFFILCCGQDLVNESRTRFIPGVFRSRVTTCNLESR